MQVFQFKKSKEKEGNKETKSCHYCKKPSHLEKNCYSWKRKQSEESQGQGSSDTIQESEEVEISNVVDSDIWGRWIIDSGCSFHICSHKEWIEEIQPAHGSVLLGNNQDCTVQRIGKIKLKLKDGSLWVLADVRLIPEIKRNQISLGVLQTKGYEFRSQNGNLEIYRNSQVLMTAIKRNSLYYLECLVVIGEACVTQNVGAEAWHKRLRHIGQKGLRLLKRDGLDIDIFQKCEDCTWERERKLPFPKGKHNSKAPLDYAHREADLQWGMGVPWNPHLF